MKIVIDLNPMRAVAAVANVLEDAGAAVAKEKAALRQERKDKQSKKEKGA